MALGGLGGISGAAMTGGPAGALIGGGLGVATGLFESNEEKKARERAENRPKRRRASKIVDLFLEARRARESGLATLAQASTDFAANLR